MQIRLSQQYDRNQRVMNILVEQLPSAIEIDGQEWPINTDFRACLRVIMAFEDVELTTQEKQVVLLENLYPSLPSNVPEAFRLGIKFLNNGEEVEEATSEINPALRLYSFSQDANFIFSAFRQTHGIDLETAEPALVEVFGVVYGPGRRYHVLQPGQFAKAGQDRQSQQRRTADVSRPERCDRLIGTDCTDPRRTRARRRVHAPG